MSEPAAENIHRSVLLQESMDILQPTRSGLFVDATIGMGGHTEAILKASSSATVIGIDQDPNALRLSAERLSQFGERLHLVRANFSDIGEAVRNAGIGKPAGIIADLGVSSLQFDDAKRGFSFRFDAPLDMRMDPDSQTRTAADLLAEADEAEIANIIYRYGEERASRRIARWIVEKREKGDPIRSTFQLADLVRRAVGRGSKDKIDPATRTFQALRIAVNHELDILERFIENSVELLESDGILAVITFHSLEDRIVKHALLRLSGKCQCPPRLPQCMCGAVRKIEILTRKPIVPSEAEREENPRSRSAKLRACRKL